MYQNRRTFIKNGLLLSAAICFPLTITQGYSIGNKNMNNIPTNELMGKGNPKLLGKGYKLRQEAHQAFQELQKAAHQAGFKPQILSSYRNYAHQKRIWDKKFTRYTQEDKLSPQKAIEKIILYSTIPGTSRHHWGTDFDVIDGAKGVANNPLNEKHFNKGGVYHEFKNWMNKHAESFGFYEVYTIDKERKGFKYEPWHFSYLPIACDMMGAYIDQEIIYSLRNSDIKGSAYFDDAFINKYYTENILDINPELIP